LSNCLFMSTCLSNLPVSLLVEGEKSIHLCGDLISAYCLTVSAFPPVSLTYPSLFVNFSI
jgi:hypothetical protein